MRTTELEPEDSLPALRLGDVDLAVTHEDVALSALSAARWVATPPGTACRAMLDRACGEAGFAPDVPFHANDFGVLAAFVEAGLGVAMVPRLALDAFAPGVVARPVADVPVTRRIYAAARRGALARPALAAMVEALQEAALTARP